MNSNKKSEYIQPIAELINKYEDFNWMIIDSDKAFFEQQVSKEIKPGHHLYGLQLTSIAKCESNDDVIFVSDDERYFIIHLTYNNNEDTYFPMYAEFANYRLLIQYIEEGYLEDD